jgi:NAD(P)H-dependent flavin oxidoreductase YrpB (nitropropane dioxygenase family)
MALSTRFTETFGVEHPIMQGGMQWVGRAELVAAIALGADGVNMGTRFMCTAGSPIHHRVKQQIVANDERSTALLFRSLRNTARVARNSVSEQVVGILADGGTFRDVRDLVAGKRGPRVYATGDPEAGIWWAGQAQG